MVTPENIENPFLGTMLKDYRVIQRLGVRSRPIHNSRFYGNNAAAYLAELKSTHQLVVLKVMINQEEVLTKQLEAHFRAEFWIVSNLPPHPNILKVYHTFVDRASSKQLPSWDCDPNFIRENTLFGVVEQMEMSLQQYLNKIHSMHLSGPLIEEGVFLHLMQQLCAAVLHLYQHGVVHRDIKPDNILLQLQTPRDQRPLLKLCDFGEAITKADCVDGFRLAFPNRQVSRGGAMMYLAPEIRSAEPSPGMTLDYSKNDCFAVGRVGYGMLSRLTPFIDERNMNWEYRTLPQSYDQGIQSLIRGLLKPDPLQRLTIESAVDMLDTMISKYELSVKVDGLEKDLIKLENKWKNDVQIWRAQMDRMTNYPFLSWIFPYFIVALVSGFIVSYNAIAFEIIKANPMIIAGLSMCVIESLLRMAQPEEWLSSKLQPNTIGLLRTIGSGACDLFVVAGLLLFSLGLERLWTILFGNWLYNWTISLSLIIVGLFMYTSGALIENAFLGQMVTTLCNMLFLSGAIVSGLGTSTLLSTFIMCNYCWVLQLFISVLLLTWGTLVDEGFCGDGGIYYVGSSWFASFSGGALSVRAITTLSEMIFGQATHAPMFLSGGVLSYFLGLVLGYIGWKNYGRVHSALAWILSFFGLIIFSCGISLLGFSALP